MYIKPFHVCYLNIINIRLSNNSHFLKTQYAKINTVTINAHSYTSIS
jgi:hypothetical protein